MLLLSMVKRDSFGVSAESSAGVAYAFFDCDAPIDVLNQDMPRIREAARTPNGLQLKLCEGVEGLVLDDELRGCLAEPANYRVMSSERIKQGYEAEARPLGSMRYAIAAEMKGVDNKRVASELGDILNVTRKYNTDQGLFRGAIAYRENGEYSLLE